jgi:SSS family transporter
LLTAGDFLVIALYLCGITVIALRFYKKGAGLQEYLLGSKAMGWLPVALSILAADTSAVTYLGQPAWVFGHDMKLNQIILCYMIAIPIVIWFFLPVYSRQQLYTAYQYLETRFGLPTRLLASALFLFLRGAHAAIIIYVPALIMSELTGSPFAVTVLIIGLLTTFYTMLGGIKAVIWTDAIQVATVFLGFTIVAVSAVHRLPGGLGEVVAIGMSNHKFALFDWSTHFERVDNSWAMALGGTILFVQSMCADQAVLQKYLTTKSERETSKSLLSYGVAIILISTLLSLLGVVLFAFSTAHPAWKAGLKNSDALVPYYVATILPHGLVGLVMASIFAGSMSTVSASLNSLATSSVVDIYRRVVRTGLADVHYTFASRCATCFWGMAATVGALFASRLGPLVTAFAKVQSELGGVLLGLFLLAFFKRATGPGAIAGAVLGFAVVVYVSVTTGISVFLYCAVGCASTVAAGWICSSLIRYGRRPESNLAPR